MTPTNPAPPSTRCVVCGHGLHDHHDGGRGQPYPTRCDVPRCSCTEYDQPTR